MENRFGKEFAGNVLVEDASEGVGFGILALFLAVSAPFVPMLNRRLPAVNGLDLTAKLEVAAVTGARVTGARVQVCLSGKRWAGQNCCLQSYILGYIKLCMLE